MISRRRKHPNFSKRYEAKGRLNFILNSFPDGLQVQGWARRIWAKPVHREDGAGCSTSDEASPLLRAWLARCPWHGVELKTRLAGDGPDGTRSGF